MPKRRIPNFNYSPVTIKGHEYLRTRIWNAEGKRVSIYGKDIEELCQKADAAQRPADDDTFAQNTPLVKDYCEKWLLMQSAHVRATTLIDYTSKVNRHIISSLGHKRIGEVTADDIKMALVPVSTKSASVFKSVTILLKCIFNSAEDSRIITYNPTRFLTAKGGGVPQQDRESLTDEQVEQLLDAIKDLPPYVFVMIGLYAGLRREEILALKWDCVFLDGEVPYISVRRAWHEEKNRPVINTRLKTKAAKRDIPIPKCLAECLREEKARSISGFVIADSNGESLSYSQFARLWNYIKVRSTAERTLTRYVNGQAIKKKFKPQLGEKCINRPDLTYCLDFEVTPHQLRHTYITNLIHAGVDPKTVQYLAGHENSKVTMDIYAKVKYNKPEQLSSVVNKALKLPSSDREEEHEES